jgi:hypothetical protein
VLNLAKLDPEEKWLSRVLLGVAQVRQIMNDLLFGAQDYAPMAYKR